jgi:hypothetical protein
MVRFGQMVRGCLLVSVLMGALACGAANAAEMPARYQGVWGIKNCDVPKSESDVGEFPYLVVTSKGYEAHESSCVLLSSSRMKSGERDALTFSCAAEGETETRKEVWSVTQKKTRIWAFTISEPFLVIGAGSGEATYRKCPFSAAMQR